MVGRAFCARGWVASYVEEATGIGGGAVGDLPCGACWRCPKLFCGPTFEKKC